jgi:hypothetical protein
MFLVEAFPELPVLTGQDWDLEFPEMDTDNTERPYNYEMAGHLGPDDVPELDDIFGPQQDTDMQDVPEKKVYPREWVEEDDGDFQFTGP